MRSILFEALSVGLIFVALCYVVRLWTQQWMVVAFVAGAAGHVLLEALGANHWFCAQF
jgi:hypothetical protein